MDIGRSEVCGIPVKYKKDKISLHLLVQMWIHSYWSEYFHLFEQQYEASTRLPSFLHPCELSAPKPSKPCESWLLRSKTNKHR